MVDPQGCPDKDPWEHIQEQGSFALRIQDAFSPILIDQRELPVVIGRRPSIIVEPEGTLLLAQWDVD